MGRAHLPVSTPSRWLLAMNLANAMRWLFLSNMSSWLLNWCSLTTDLKNLALGEFCKLAFQFCCRRCSNYIIIIDLTSGFKGFGKDSRKTVRESFKCWDLVRLILETWRSGNGSMPWVKGYYMRHCRPRSMSAQWVKQVWWDFISRWSLLPGTWSEKAVYA